MKDDVVDDGLRVLIVEDEERLRNLLVREIGAMGHQADGVARAETALNRLRAKPVDVVMLDLNLPGMNGMELFTHIRDEKMPCAVVILTGHGALDSAIEAVRLHAVDYLSKPCSLGDIDRVLSGIEMRIRAERREAAQRRDAAERAAMAAVVVPAPVQTTTAASTPMPASKPEPIVPLAAARENAPVAAESTDAGSPPKTLEELECEHILRVLGTYGGNKPAAAEALGISLRTLYNKLNAYEQQGKRTSGQ